MDDLQPIRNMLAPWKIQYGQRLLARGNAGMSRFRDFVAVAEDFVRLAPDIVPKFLAGLVALDISADEQQPAPREPGRN